MSSPPSLQDILNSLLQAIQAILSEIADAIASNAGVIATAIVVGGMVYFVARYGTRMMRSVMGWVRGIF